MNHLNHPNHLNLLNHLNPIPPLSTHEEFKALKLSDLRIIATLGVGGFGRLGNLTLIFPLLLFLFPLFSPSPSLSPSGIPVLHSSMGGNRWDLLSGGKGVGVLYGSISTIYMNLKSLLVSFSHVN